LYPSVNLLLAAEGLEAEVTIHPKAPARPTVCTLQASQA